MNKLTCPICNGVLDISGGEYECEHCCIKFSRDKLSKIDDWRTVVSTSNTVDALPLIDSGNVKYLPFEIDTPKARYSFLKFVLFHSRAFKNIGLRESGLTVEPLLLPVYVANNVQCGYGMIWHDTVHVDWEAFRGTRTYSGKNDYLKLKCGNGILDNMAIPASSESMCIGGRHFTYESVLPYDFSKQEATNNGDPYKRIMPDKNFECAKSDLKVNALVKIRSVLKHKEGFNSSNDISVDSEDIAHSCSLNGNINIVYVPVYKVTFSVNEVTYGGYVNGQSGKAFGLIPNQVGSLEVRPKYFNWILALLIIAAVYVCSTRYKTGWFGDLIVGVTVLFAICCFLITQKRLKYSHKLENTLMGTAHRFIKVKQLKQTINKKIKLYCRRITK